MIVITNKTEFNNTQNIRSSNMFLRIEKLTSL
jgi:hypothetical protein